MPEVYKDLWSIVAPATIITTNGFVKKDGNAVMGRGCALEAAKRWPDLPLELGACLRDSGNHVFDLKQVALTKETDELIESWTTTLITFPVKHNWWERADIDLIVRSTQELIGLVDRMGWQQVVMPRPGCGNGQLEWSGVKVVIEDLLDRRFIICHK